MDRWELVKPNKNIVFNDQISGDRAPITEEEQLLVPLIAKMLYDRSLRYYVIATDYERLNEPTPVTAKHIDEHYMGTAWLIYEAAKKLSQIPGGKGYGSHSLKTWIAIIMGKESEEILI